MTDKTDALVLVRRSQLIELQAEVSDDASLAHERIRSILAAQPAASVVAVDEAMVDRAIRAFENEPASHTDDDWDRRCMRAALTAALADGEAASA